MFVLHDLHVPSGLTLDRSHLLCSDQRPLGVLCFRRFPAASVTIALQPETAGHDGQQTGKVEIGFQWSSVIIGNRR